jgi:transcription initiation factor TFIIB
MDEADRLAVDLDLSRDVRALGTEYYRDLRSQGKLPGCGVEEVIAAALYLGCKKNNVPRSPDEFAECSEYTKKQILRTAKYLEAVLDVDIEPTDPTMYVSRFAEELGVEDETKQEAMEILDVTIEEGLHAGKSPTGVAAAALYTAGLVTGNRLTQAEVAEIAEVTTVTVRERYQEQFEAYSSDT